jgi:hypothetical protein
VNRVALRKNSAHFTRNATQLREQSMDQMETGARDHAIPGHVRVFAATAAGSSGCHPASTTGAPSPERENDPKYFQPHPLVAKLPAGMKSRNPDSKGHYITGLTASDFVIEEDGKPRQITNLGYIQAGSKPSPRPSRRGKPPSGLVVAPLRREECAGASC